MILVLGAKGQVGSALMRRLGDGALGMDRREIVISESDSIARTLDRHDPAAVINAAAYTAVDKAQSDRETAFLINAIAPGLLAEACAARDIPFMHFSTDYVFDGEGNIPWTEEDEPAPLNVYGDSKLAGEEAVQAAGGRHLIFRTSWVYDEGDSNFVSTMLRLGREREELRVVNDQFGAPTYASHLAEACLVALSHAQEQHDFPSGLYHLCNGGETTWYGFAQAIFEQAREMGEALKVQRVLPIGTSEYPTPATRPQNSRLSCAKAKRLLHVQMPPWQEGLQACMKLKYAHSLHTPA